MTEAHMQPPETAPYVGPAIGWLVNAGMWLMGGMSPLAAIGAVAALWWTVERALTERAKRRVLTGIEDAPGGSLASRLRRALKTEPGEL